MSELTTLCIDGACLDNTDTTYEEATTTTAGLMSAADKEKLDTFENYWGRDAGGGLYNPITADPTMVGAYSVLLTDAKGIYAGSREFVIVAGNNFNLKGSHPAGSTEYRFTNNFGNRIQLAAIKDGRATLSIDTAGEYTVQIVSVLFEDGTVVYPYSGNALPEHGDIIVTVEESANPDSATSKLRLYGKFSSNDIVSVGQANGSSGGKVLQVGQALRAEANQVIEVGNQIYVKANNNAGFGHSHIITQMYCLFAGQGHDGTNGWQGVTAVGKWSVIEADTKFVVGYGTGDTDRKNLFEVKDDNGATALMIVSPGGNKFKLTVDDQGNLSTTPV